MTVPFIKPNIEVPTSKELVERFGDDVQSVSDFVRTLEHEAWKFDADFGEEVDLKISSSMKEYLMYMSGTNYCVPKKRREKVWDIAYDQGHSEGYLFIFYELQKLVELFT